MANTNPYHHFEFAELVNVSSIGIFSHRSVQAILSEHLASGGGEDRGVRYANCWFEVGNDITMPDHFVVVTGGAIHFSNCTFKLDPNVAYAKVAATARAGALSFDGCQFVALAGGPRTKPICLDQRANPEF